MNDKSMRRSAPGFTMIELIVAVTILVILAGASVPVYNAVSRKARVGATKSEMSHIAEALRAYARDVGFAPDRLKWGRFPPEATGKGKYPTILGMDLEEDKGKFGWDPVLRKGWNGPYLAGEVETTDADGDGKPEAVRSYQVDAWGRYYIYTNRDEKGKFVGAKSKMRIVRLVSGGPDRNPSTGEDNIELTIFQGPVF